MNRIAAVIAGLSLAFIGTSATIADTINVPADQPTIAAAISASVNGDVINIAAGTYNEHSLDTDGKAITIQGTLNGDGTLATTIDAQQGARVFSISSGEGLDTVIQDLVITGGLASNGGGIYCYYASSPTISGCTIEGNTANSNGGGIYCGWDSFPTITNCTIEGNTSYNYGGGIYCWDSFPTITDCDFINNSADFGGGIYCIISNPTITGCTISSNTAIFGGGGGIRCYASSPTISGCTISGNNSPAGDEVGGGISSVDGNYISNPTISDSEICGNEPDQINGNYTDAGGNTVADECPFNQCTGDLDGNQLVDIEDLLLAISGWNTDSGDTNDDGMTDITDLLLIIALWGTTCS